MARTCYGFGDKTGTCTEEALPEEYWCASCQEARLAHLSKRFEEIERHFKTQREKLRL